MTRGKVARSVCQLMTVPKEGGTASTDCTTSWCLDSGASSRDRPTSSLKKLCVQRASWTFWEVCVQFFRDNKYGGYTPGERPARSPSAFPNRRRRRSPPRGKIKIYCMNSVYQESAKVNLVSCYCNFNFYRVH